MRKSKQVLVIRKDLRNVKGEKLRSGKMIAQGAHAAMNAILDKGSFSPNEGGGDDFFLDIPRDSALSDWLFGVLKTKVCVSVDSEAELEEIFNKAKEAGLICSMVVDAGLTEFGGVPTKTCCSIGPNWSDEIDPITKHLSLL